MTLTYIALYVSASPQKIKPIDMLFSSIIQQQYQLYDHLLFIYNSSEIKIQIQTFSSESKCIYKVNISNNRNWIRSQ